MKERIQKLLSAAGVASRRHIEEMVLQGRIGVNGDIITTLPIMVDAQRDKVTVDGEPIRLANRISAERIYLLMYKPKGVHTTNVAQGEQTRAIDLLPREFPYRVYPVGRLDAEAQGLLLLTNDGDLANKLTHPRFGVPKTYRASVDGFVKPADVQELENGIWLSDPKRGNFKTGKLKINIVHRSRDRSVLELTLREGRNGQVRRMLARIGHKVRDLTRIKFGPLNLKGLSPGDFRELTPRELRDLRKPADQSPATTPRSTGKPRPASNHRSTGKHRSTSMRAGRAG